MDGSSLRGPSWTVELMRKDGNMKRTLNKLTLRRETLHLLREGSLRDAAGGNTPTTCTSLCPTNPHTECKSCVGCA